MQAKRFLYVCAGLLCLALALAGCQNRRASRPNGPAPCEKVTSWPPLTTPDREGIPESTPGVRPSFRVPREDPITAKGSEILGEDGHFWPRENLYVVTGGTLLSEAGPVQKRARFGGWAFIYDDSTKARKRAWGECITDGEMVVDTSFLSNTIDTTSGYAENACWAKVLGGGLVLIGIDSTRNHRICIVDFVPTLGVPGSQMEIAGQIYERHTDGWYRCR